MSEKLSAQQEAELLQGWYKNCNKVIDDTRDMLKQLEKSQLTESESLRKTGIEAIGVAVELKMMLKEALRQRFKIDVDTYVPTSLQ